MLGTHFENQLIRKYISVFGTLFNNISIARSDGTDNKDQFFKVPLSYGPREKFLAMVMQRPGNERKQAIQLPRISYEFTGMSFDSTRKINRKAKIVDKDNIFYYGSPWNFNFQLSIITKGDLDATKIAEQILFYFQPDYTVDVKLLNVNDHTDRIPIQLDGVSHENTYEGDFESRRVITWTMDFTLKGFLYGTDIDKKVIKFIDIGIHGDLDETSNKTRITIQPGTDANGDATTDINLTIPYTSINFEDDWAVIEQNLGYGEHDD